MQGATKKQWDECCFDDTYLDGDYSASEGDCVTEGDVQSFASLWNS